MAQAKKGLGKGLDALFNKDFSADFSVPPSTLPISQIECHPGQPRKHFDEEKLEELADSIRQHGVIQPLTVRRLHSGYYQIVAGERRWRAARKAGLAEIPAIVIECDNRTAMELAMVENLQREDLNPIEEAEGFQALLSEYGLTQEQIAAEVGKSRSAVANALRLLDLNEDLRALVAGGRLSAGHARALLPLPAAERDDVVKIILDGGLSVRETEHLVKKRLQADLESASSSPDDPPLMEMPVTADYFAEAGRELSNHIGRACRIVRGKKKGRIEIEYYNLDDLNALLEALGKIPV